jgi:hypothetical protein
MTKRTAEGMATPTPILEIASIASHNFRIDANRAVKTLRWQNTQYGAGCSWCCAIPVDVSAPEAVNIADHLRRTLSTDRYAALLERVRTVAARVSTTSGDSTPSETAT